MMSFLKRGFIAYLFLIKALHAEVNLYDIYDHTIPFSSLKGKWVFFNYWASWCEPCLEEIPELNRFYNQNKDKNVILFAVNYEDRPASMQSTLVKEYNIHYPALKNDPGFALNLGDIQGVPVTFVFDTNGKFHTVLYGLQTQQSLNQLLHT